MAVEVRVQDGRRNDPQGGKMSRYCHAAQFDRGKYCVTHVVIIMGDCSDELFAYLSAMSFAVNIVTCPDLQR